MPEINVNNIEGDLNANPSEILREKNQMIRDLRALIKDQRGLIESLKILIEKYASNNELITEALIQLIKKE